MRKASQEDALKSDLPAPKRPRFSLRKSLRNLPEERIAVQAGDEVKLLSISDEIVLAPPLEAAEALEIPLSGQSYGKHCSFDSAASLLRIMMSGNTRLRFRQSRRRDRRA